MVTSAKGAEQFYSIEDHATRKEGLDEARERDTRAAEAWIGHPYVDIIDNSRYVCCTWNTMLLSAADRCYILYHSQHIDNCSHIPTSYKSWYRSHHTKLLF
jgi:hypothetical protein